MGMSPTREPSCHPNGFPVGCVCAVCGCVLGVGGCGCAVVVVSVLVYVRTDPFGGEAYRIVRTIVEDGTVSYPERCWLNPTSV